MSSTLRQRWAPDALRANSMTTFEIVAFLLTVAAAFAYVNHRWIRRPPAIGLMAMSLIFSLGMVGLDHLGVVAVADAATSFADRVGFKETLMNGMLGALLFAGALHVSWTDLREEKGSVATLAVAGTVLSTFVVGALCWIVLRAVSIEIPLGFALLFGALISPTDPIAVLGILKQAKVPRRLEIQITGESLFNDGVGVVIFTTILGVVSHGGGSVADVGLLFVREALGGVLFGAATGYVTFRLLRSIDHYQTELLLTLALVTGGYTLAQRLHISAPIAAVVAGLIIGNQGRQAGMSETTRDHLDKFWTLVDEILNAILFVLVGLEVVHLSLTGQAVVAGLLMIPIVLAARFVSVALPVKLLSLRRPFAPGTVRVLTWGGLRGGISVALALSAPAGPERDLIVTMTYFVVAFSILAQGLTLGRLAQRFRMRSALPVTPGDPTV